MLNKRHYNKLTINYLENTITKSSDVNGDNIQDEILWYKNLPLSLASIKPDIISYNNDKYSYEMKYISSPYELGYNFLNQKDYSGNEQINFLKKVFSVIRQFQDEAIPQENFPKSNYEMFVNKTLKRLDEYDGEILQLVNKHGLSIGGYIYKYSKTEIKEIIIKKYKDYQYEIDNPKNFGIIHGDLHLSNLFYNRDTDDLKIIDPRGSYGSQSLYGNIYYDIGKLAHSILGKYDLIINDNFSLKIDTENGINYELTHNSITKETVLFFLELVKNQGLSLDIVYYLQGLLFLSMVPLHNDSTDRQIIMLLTGLNFLFNPIYIITTNTGIFNLDDLK